MNYQRVKQIISSYDSLLDEHLDVLRELNLGNEVRIQIQKDIIELTKLRNAFKQAYGY